MTRRQALLAGAGGVAVIAAAQRLARRPSERGATLRLNARSRVEREGVVESLEKPVLWKAAESAVVICDMWDDHYCRNSVSRLEAMIPEMNRVVRNARELGVAIVHAPSGTMDFYAGTPQRERMQAAPHAEPPVPIAKWCHLDPESEGAFPIHDEHPCDDESPGERKRAWHRQHPDLAMADEDGISDDGQEIFNYFAQHGIANVVLMGVHTNLCVLGRPFGIRQQVRLGNNVVLARDLTDSMYDPRDPPYVSHERGTELVIEHIERYWCPSIIGNDLTTAADLT
ncbi:MAG: cysteine hydrolase [Acidobacteriia bacterium]|nr:cysteine hydrolase [Terriglobia bacterium]MYC65822.1 cysteine hydrolase [Terriglobia bacterium]